jgi:cell division protein FtsL
LLFLLLLVPSLLTAMDVVSAGSRARSLVGDRLPD